MSDTNQLDETIAPLKDSNDGSVGTIDDTVRQGGINQGQGSGTQGDLNDASPEAAALRRARMNSGDLVDDNAASHQGGMGAQSGQADYGSAGNLAGMGGNGKGGSNPQP